jgi:PAS domain S-box-containing protein
MRQQIRGSEGDGYGNAPLDNITQSPESASADITNALKREIEQARSDRERLDLALLVSGIIGVWDGDLVGGKVYGDANFARIYRMDPAEVAAGRPLGYYFEQMHPDDFPGADAARKRMMAGEGDFSHEHRIIYPDGSHIWVAARGRLLRDDTGRPVRFIGVSVDITERRQAEARQAFLLELQDLMRGLTEPREILTAAATHLGRHLGAGRIGYGEVQPDDETVLITNGYVDGLPPFSGLIPLSIFGAHYPELARDGKNIVRDDVLADPDANAAAWSKIGTRAHLSVPLIRHGRFIGSLYVSHARPHKWTAPEISLIEAVAARIWDAAERGRAEAKLRESEERLRLVLDSTGLGSWEYDVATGKTIRSARHDEIFGYTEPVADWSYERFQTHIPQADQERVVAGFRAAIDDGTDLECECRMIRADGTPGWLKIRATPHRGPDGAIARLLGTVADISARKQAEADALATGQKFEMFAQTMPSMVWTSLPDGRIDWFNARVPEYCGIDEEKMRPDGWSPVHPEDVEASSSQWLAAVAAGTPYSAEYRIRRHDGEYRWHITRAVPIRGADGAITRWIGTSADIQDQKNTETQLAELNATLERQVFERTAELMAAEESLRQSQKMEAVGQLTGGLAHDFNNLLTGISGSLELLEARLAQGRYAELDRYLNVAQGAAKRAAALTHRLLAFSRRQTLDPKPVELNRLAAGMDELIRRTVGPAVNLRIEAATGLWMTLADPNQLENALLNLCINARDAMPDGGSLTIETANRLLDADQARAMDLQAGPYVSLSVSDTGGGMTADVMARAFDPFFTTKPIGAGTGLGLSMVYGFVRQSGGQARIYSEAGQGTTVSLYLPRYAGEQDLPEMAAARPAEQRGDGETVLVVDDEPTVRMLVNEVLEELGYDALEAEDAVAGLKVLESRRRVDLLVTDVGLPGGMNGRQLAEAALAARPDLKILFITGYAETTIISGGDLRPGMHIVTKPFSLETLARRIKEIIAG